MNNLELYTELEQLLRMESRYCSEDGVLLKNAIVEGALQLRPDLLKLLMGHERLRDNFFTDVDGITVFDKIRFQKFVMNKRFLVDSYTSFKNKIGLTGDDGDFLAESREVVLSWPYKDCVLEGGQTKEDVKRNEIFWNEILAPDQINRLTEPKVFTNFKRYTVDGEQMVDSISKNDNLIIKGNNLLALHSLKKNYSGKVKLIYIDPPYNTGNDGFQYNDTFNHSSWLTFMQNRLEIAKDLLTTDGWIFVSIDDNEQPYLRMLCDSIFSRKNFVSDIVIQSNKGGRDYLKIAKSHEYLICYQKSDQSTLNDIERKDGAFSFSDSKGGFNIRELRNRNPKFNRGNRPNLFFPYYVDPNNINIDGFCSASLEKSDSNSIEVFPRNSVGVDSCWRWGKPKAALNLNQIIDASEIVAKQKTDGGWNIYEKHRKTTSKAKSIWDDTAVRTEAGTKELRSILGDGVFAFPKPVELIKRVVEIASNEGDIILDFFCGSGTTGQAVLELNEQSEEERTFILVEQMDYVAEVTVPRLQKVISKGSFVYCELTKANQAFVDEIEEATTKEQLIQIWERMQATGFLSWKLSPKMINDAAADFADLLIEDMKRFLIESLDKNLLYVPLSEINNYEFAISDEDKNLNSQFYGK